MVGIHSHNRLIVVDAVIIDQRNAVRLLVKLTGGTPADVDQS